MRAQHRLDLGRIDVEAGADDHLLGATDDEQRFAFEAREVAGVEPAVGIDRLRGEIRRAIVAAHHVRPADMQFADLAIRATTTPSRPTILASIPGSKRADRIVAARRLRPNAGDSRRAFGDAKGVAERQTELLLDPRLEFEIERRAGDAHQAQRAAIELRQARHLLVFQQPLIGGGHAVQERDAFFGQSPWRARPDRIC